MRVSKFIKVLMMTLPLLLSTFGCGNTGAHRTASSGSDQDEEEEESINAIGPTCVSTKTKKCPVVSPPSGRKGGTPAPAPANPGSPAPAAPAPTFVAEKEFQCREGKGQCDWKANNKMTECSGNIRPKLENVNGLRYARDEACGSAARKSPKCVYAESAFANADGKHSLGTGQCDDQYLDRIAACHTKKVDCDGKVFLKQKYFWKHD